ncbi:MAG: diguanylate cyclase [Burkholderiales bacterium]|nr:diguanylate cyclase [Burkholderiales bacterium]
MNEDDLISNLAKEHVIRASGLLSLLMPQSTGVGIAIKDLDGRYQLANKAMEDLLGKRAEQILSLTDADVFPPAMALQLERSDCQIRDGAPAASDELEVSQDGTAVNLLWLKFPVFGSEGQILSIGSMVVDLSNQDTIAEMRQSLKRLQHTNQELQKSLLELDILAGTDKLTGAWNRRRLQEAVGGEMDRLKRYDHPLSLVMMDIDRFKQINDQHGHAVGDQVLVQLVGIVQTSLRTSDALTRWGGDEFIILCPNTTLSTSTTLAQRLLTEIRKARFPVVESLTASFGVAQCLSTETWEQWMARGDAALYRAKTNGRDQVHADAHPLNEGLGGEKVAPHFLQLTWRDAYESGHPRIDEQHRLLFNNANDLLAAVLSGRPKEEVAELIGALMRNVVQHFHDEEAIFSDAGYPSAARHAAVHSHLINKGLVMVSHFHEDRLTLGELFQFLAHEVVARHILGSDREFFPFLETARAL